MGKFDEARYQMFREQFSHMSEDKLLELRTTLEADLLTETEEGAIDATRDILGDIDRYLNE